jgi:MOB kinase activator 1
MPPPVADTAIRRARHHRPTAVNTVLFYNAASVLYSVLDGTLCNDELCPIMNAGPQYEYLWADGVKVKNPIKLSAPRYVNALFDHIEEQLDDPSLFPRGIGGRFPKDFLMVVKNILKRLFRVYAHMYHSHFRSILALGMESHLNMSFRHMVLFIKEFDLVDDRDLAPMSELINRLMD